MISDVLADAAHEVRSYLRDLPEVYAEPSLRAEIEGVLNRMDAVRIRLDTPPGTDRESENL